MWGGEVFKTRIGLEVIWDPLGVQIERWYILTFTNYDQRPS